MVCFGAEKQLKSTYILSYQAFSHKHGFQHFIVTNETYLLIPFSTNFLKKHLVSHLFVNQQVIYTHHTQTCRQQGYTGDAEAPRRTLSAELNVCGQQLLQLCPNRHYPPSHLYYCCQDACIQLGLKNYKSQVNTALWCVRTTDKVMAAIFPC